MTHYPDCPSLDFPDAMRDQYAPQLASPSLGRKKRLPPSQAQLKRKKRLDPNPRSCTTAVLFFVWMLHGSTKVVVRAVALLSAKTKWIVANTLERFFHESNKFEKHNEKKPPTTLQSPGECRGGWVKPVPRAVRSRASWQRREHACQPPEGEGNSCSTGWKMLQILKRIKFWLFATSMLSRLKKERGQGETTAARRDGAPQGNCHRTIKGRVQQTPDERTTDRDLRAPSPATVPTIPYQSGDTGGQILGKHLEKTDG